MVNHNVFNKIAVINDMTGFGRCALTVEIPIISQMGIQCCPVPTSILSNHSAYKSFYIKDLTSDMEAYMTEWHKLKLKFNGVLTGFCGSFEQIDIAKRFIDEFSDADTKIIVDPIMGDNGKTYSIYDGAMCQKMKELVSKAHIITPNLTELCILADKEYNSQYGYNEIGEMCRNVIKLMKDNSSIVVTGINSKQFISNFIYEREKSTIIRKRIAGESRCGTGDVFSSVLAASVIKGSSLSEAVKKAADFVAECIRESDKINMPKTDGVCFEKILHKLH